MDKFIRLGQRLLAWFRTKKGLFTSGFTGLAFTLLTAAVFVTCSIYHNDPSLFQSEEFCSLRAKTIAEGVEKTSETIAASTRADKLSETVTEDGTMFRVAPSQNASDFYEFAFDTPWSVEKGDYLLRTNLANGSFSSLNSLVTPFTIEVRLLTNEGKTPVTQEGYYTAVRKSYCFDENLVITETSASNRHGLLDEADWAMCQKDMNALAEKAMHGFDELAKKVGFSSGEAFRNGAVRTHRGIVFLYHFSYTAIPFSVLATVFVSLFLGSLIGARADKNKREEPVAEEEGPAKPPSPRSAAISAFLDRHHIRPFLGEWFFRGIGLAFLGVGSIVLSLIAKSQWERWGEGWNYLATNWGDFFQTLSSLGSVMLIVVVIGIITELRQNLNLSAWCFFTLAVGYYMVACTICFASELYYARFGTMFANSLAPTLPGNIFLGIGLFAIIGFFLFYDPPEKTINRKVFRALCLIPIALAIASVALTYAYRSENYSPSFWIRNIFFIRSSNILFIGILYELFVFFFYRVIARRRGTKTVDFDSLTPLERFQKNLTLCLLLLLLVIIFYLIPEGKRQYFGFDSERAFFYVLIPFFLFYKSSPSSHKMRDDILYYALYAVIWALPSIPAIIEVISQTARMG